MDFGTLPKRAISFPFRVSESRYEAVSFWPPRQATQTKEPIPTELDALVSFGLELYDHLCQEFTVIAAALVALQFVLHGSIQHNAQRSLQSSRRYM
jgi:hypothetical protein